jgi:hypothetical protein
MRAGRSNGKPVILPDQNAVEAATAGISHQGVEGGSAPVPAHVPADAIHILAVHRKAAASGIVPQLAKL